MVMVMLLGHALGLLGHVSSNATAFQKFCFSYNAEIHDSGDLMGLCLQKQHESRKKKTIELKNEDETRTGTTHLILIQFFFFLVMNQLTQENVLRVGDLKAESVKYDYAEIKHLCQ